MYVHSWLVWQWLQIERVLTIFYLVYKGFQQESNTESVVSICFCQFTRSVAPFFVTRALSTCRKIHYSQGFCCILKFFLSLLSPHHISNYGHMQGMCGVYWYSSVVFFLQNTTCTYKLVACTLKPKPCWCQGKARRNRIINKCWLT